jgi:hypothetical protein
VGRDKWEEKEIKLGYGKSRWGESVAIMINGVYRVKGRFLRDKRETNWSFL